MLNKKIGLEGIEITAPIGYYAEERINKCDFIIDIAIEEIFDEHNNSDDIHNTINYERLFDIIKKEMAIECKLIENVAHRIYKSVFELDSNILSINLTIRKKKPPLKGNVRYSKVELNWQRD
jgi:dihydroneopterin aldolase